MTKRDEAKARAKALGHHTYQGNPCLRGHSGLRYTTGVCVECMRESYLRSGGPSRKEARERNAKSRAAREAAVAAGLNEYIGTPCSLGHTRRYLSGGCIECNHANAKDWNKKNKQKPNRATYMGRPCKLGHSGLRHLKDRSCVECKKTRGQGHYRDNRDQINKRHREYQKKNPHIARAAQRRKKAKNNYQKYQGNPCKYGHSGLRYPDGRCVPCHYERLKATRPQLKAAHHRRRARLRGAEGSFTKDDIARIRKAQRDKCAYCRVKLTKAEIDHIVALAKGGSNHPRNLQILCDDCNRRKNAKDSLDFARSLGLLL